LVFLAVASWLWIESRSVSEAVPELGGGVRLPAGSLSTAPQRAPLGDPPIVHLAGFDRTCMECHRIFDPAERATAARSDTDRVQHSDVVLAHGRNDRCLGCHHATDRDALSLLDGTKIGFAEAPRLCRECHGLVGRDWERGTHGRTHGSWVTGSPEQRRLGCTECHDPHSPAFPALEPLPAPRTLRLPPPEEREPRSAEPLWPRSAIEAAKGHDG
jgi:hypothetical protein